MATPVLSGLHKTFRIIRTAVWDFFQDHLTTASAALAFYALFSGFPLLLLAVSASSLFMEPEDAVERVQGVLREYIPIGAKLVEDSLEGAVQAGGTAAGLSVVALLWSGSRIFAHSVRPLNYAWGVEHGYAIRTRVVLYPLFVLVAVLLLAFGLLYPLIMGPVWLALTGGFQPPTGGPWELAGEVAQQTFGILILVLLYRYLPRRNVPWRDAVPSAVVAILLLNCSQEVFEYYMHGFGDRYTYVYGPLHDIAVLLLWAYLSAVIFLFSAEIGAAWAQVRADDRRSEEAIADAVGTAGL